jgi:hypothetical protein
MKRLLAFGLSLGLVAALAVPAAAGGPGNKATGSGTWLNAQGHSQMVAFNAHEAEGVRPAKGLLYQESYGGTVGTFSVDVQVVAVTAAGACFGGPQIAGTDGFAARNGQWRWTTVIDGGAGIDETGMDYLRGGHTTSASVTPPAWCSTYDVAGNEAWWGGNVQIHLGKSYNDLDTN